MHISDAYFIEINSRILKQKAVKKVFFSYALWLDLRAGWIWAQLRCKSKNIRLAPIKNELSKQVRQSERKIVKIWARRWYRQGKKKMVQQLRRAPESNRITDSPCECAHLAVRCFMGSTHMTQCTSCHKCNISLGSVCHTDVELLEERLHFCTT